MNHIERRKLYAEMADAAQKEHYGRSQEKQMKESPQPTDIDSKKKDALLKLKEYGFDQQHVDEIFKEHFDEFFILSEISRSQFTGYVDCFKRLANAHEKSITYYKRCLSKMKSDYIHAFGADVQVERMIERLELDLEWAKDKCSPTKSIVKMLTAQAKEMFTYIRNIEKSYYPNRDVEKIPDMHIYEVIADLLNSFYRSSNFFYPFVNLSKESDHETISRRRKLTAKDVKTFLDNEVQHPPKAI